jgi:hypothetical protein
MFGLFVFMAMLGFALLAPTDAMAWGPISHIVHGSTILGDLSALPAAVRNVLAAYPDHYLYGCVGADIIQAKAYTRSVATHCHRWPIAWTLVDGARTPKQRAFAWGYMTHLGADIISHNHFVPAQLVRSFDSRSAGHAYWEARADALQRVRFSRSLREVLEGRYEECDELVDRVIRDTLFSFKTNKKIFDSLMAVSKLERWQAFMTTVNRRSRYTLTRPTVDRFNADAIAAAHDLLRRGRRSSTQERDPTGSDVLERATALRRKLRVLKKNRRLPRGLEHEMAAELLPAEWS